MINTYTPVYQLTPNLFIQMLKTGAQKILVREKEINAINVFPVSDHDTGTNVASLMRFLLSTQYPVNSFTDLFKKVADSSLIGAAGNSGIIFSAFFSGLAINKTLHRATLSTQEFLNCIHAGVSEAYNAVAQPIEGTILTVMQAWVHAFKDHAQNSNDFTELFTNSIQQAEETLAKTQVQLAILEENRVVDAGAYAFLLLLKGMLDGLTAEDITDYSDEKIDNASLLANPVDIHELQSDFQYCFESILLTDADPKAIRTALEPLGDSLAINKSPSFLKIHLHTNDLITATNHLQKFGSIQNQKVDDMRRQFTITHHRKHSIALITDSSADLPKSFIEAHQIHVIPIQIRLGEHALLDGLTINLEQLYAKMYAEDIAASTSVPAPEPVLRQLSYLATHYDSLIAVTLSSKLSGIHQLLSQQAKKIPDKRITVFDSRTKTVAHGMIVMKAAELITKGLSHDEIIVRLEALAAQTKVFALINDFKTIVKSGRAPRAVEYVANWTQFRPIITADHAGNTSIASVAFGSAMSEKKILQLVKKHTKEKSSYCLGIAHSGDLEKAERIAKLINEETGITPLFIQEASSAIGLHAGRGCIGIAILGDTLKRKLD